MEDSLENVELPILHKPQWLSIQVVHSIHEKNLDKNVTTLAGRLQHNTTLFLSIQNNNIQEPKYRERKNRLLPKIDTRGSVVQHLEATISLQREGGVSCASLF